MIPVERLVVTRTQGDTDPIYAKLSVQNAGEVTLVPSSANVTLSMALANTVVVTGTSSSNGSFSFDMSGVDTANVSVAPFDIIVDSDYRYVIASGTINFRASST